MTDAAARDARFMRRALALARRGKHTHPNPAVGAVVVRDDEIVGEGFHQGVGTLHGEALALKNAGERAWGATVYVTLEPCSHTHRASGEPRVPCVARCIEAGVARVVAALEDPDPQVNGQGIIQLRAAGIQALVGVGMTEARKVHRAYLHHRTTGLPYITHKAAMTLDGKIAAPRGDSKWVTGEAARARVHRLRDRVDALVVGVGTVLADNPSLTTRLPRGNGHDPLRVLIDSELRTPPGAKAARAGTLILGAAGRAGESNAQSLRETGAEVVVLPAGTDGRVDVTCAAQLLAQRGLLDVLLESGGELAASFWAASLVNEVLFFVAPKIMGGTASATPIGGIGIAPHMAGARNLGKMTVTRFGSDLAVQAIVVEKAETN